VTGVCDPREESNASLSRLMIGAEPPALAHRESSAGATVLRTQALSLPRVDQFGVDLYDIDLEVRAGEVVGIAGISGNGQKELLYALSGEDTRAAPGMVQIGGQNAARLGPRQRRALGLHFVPEERLGRGAVPSMGLAHNLLLTRSDAVGPGGWLRMRQLQAQARGIIERFQVKAGGPDAAAKSLSGGNLQKFIVGREIGARPRLFIVSQPTWGVDVGAAGDARRGLRGAGGERGAGRAVRDLRPPLRAGQGATVALRAARRGLGGAHRRMDERAVACRRTGPSGTAGGGPCSSLRRVPRPRGCGRMDRPCWRWRSRC
jgi:simple sugar transport system ATP-binding protein